MFYFKYQTDEKVGEEEWAEAKQRSGSVKEFNEIAVRALPVFECRWEATACTRYGW